MGKKYGKKKGKGRFATIGIFFSLAGVVYLVAAFLLIFIGRRMTWPRNAP